MTGIVDHDLCGLRELVAAGDVSPPEILQAHIDRIEAVEPLINGFVQTGFDAALAEAGRLEAGQTDGKLHGLPFAVKDCLEVDGWITTFGTAGTPTMCRIIALRW